MGSSTKRPRMTVRSLLGSTDLHPCFQRTYGSSSLDSYFWCIENARMKEVKESKNWSAKLRTCINNLGNVFVISFNLTYVHNTITKNWTKKAQKLADSTKILRKYIINTGQSKYKVDIAGRGKIMKNNSKNWRTPYRRCKTATKRKQGSDPETLDWPVPWPMKPEEPTPYGPVTTPKMSVEPLLEEPGCSVLRTRPLEAWIRVGWLHQNVTGN